MTTDTTPPTIVIRSYQPSDLSACQEIFSTANHSDEHPMFFIDHIFQTDMADIEKNYLQIPNGHWWVAVSTDDNRVVGHVAALPLSLGDSSHYYELPEDERDQICELRRMAVAPDVQRKGVGNKLLSTLIDFARQKGYRQVQLTTSNFANLDKVCAFYERNGFKKIRMQKFSFENVLSEKSQGAEEVFRKLPKPVIFEADAIIPDEDLHLMKMSPTQSKYMYLIRYSLVL